MYLVDFAVLHVAVHVNRDDHLVPVDGRVQNDEVVMVEKQHTGHGTGQGLLDGVVIAVLVDLHRSQGHGEISVVVCLDVHS